MFVEAVDVIPVCTANDIIIELVNTSNKSLKHHLYSVARIFRSYSLGFAPDHVGTNAVDCELCKGLVG